MGGFLNFRILENPVNWLLVIVVLLFVSYSAFAIYSNSGALTPKLPSA
jgi:hypothetical protein